MQTSFTVNQAVALEGQPYGEVRHSVPRQLPYLAQVTQGVIADSESGAWVHTFTDSKTGQVYTLTTTVAGATEATTLDNLVTAFNLHAKLRDLFTLAEDGSDTYTLTAKHANREYTLTSVPPGSMTDVITIPTASGGAGAAMGRFVADGAADGEFRVLASGDTISNVLGILFRTDGNHFHSLENDTPTAVDALERGKHYSIMQHGRCWMHAETALVKGGAVYIVVDDTGTAGELGRPRNSAAGAAQVSTVAPTVNHMHYAISFDFEGEQFDIAYTATDVTTAVADAIDGLYDNAIEQLTAAGIEAIVVATESATLLTFTVAAGRQIDNLRNAAHGLDAEAVSCVVSQGAADLEAIEASAIVYVEEAAAAGALVPVQVRGLS
jgi:hypothetical protein